MEWGFKGEPIKSEWTNWLYRQPNFGCVRIPWVCLRMSPGLNCIWSRALHLLQCRILEWKMEFDVLIIKWNFTESHKVSLGAIQKCQHFHECTNSTLFQTPSPPTLLVYRPTFLGSTIWVSRSIIFIVKQQKINPSFNRLICNKW